MKRKSIATILATILMLTLSMFAFIGCGDKAHEHELSKVAGTAATCTEDGTEDYYKCECGELFADAAGTVELTAPKAIPALGHQPGTVWSQTAGKHYHICGRCSAHVDEAACTPSEYKQDSNGHYHECTVCGTRLDSAPHREVAITTPSEPTCTEDGTTAGIKCDDCGYIIEQATSRPAIGHARSLTVVDSKESYAVGESIDKATLTVTYECANNAQHNRVLEADEYTIDKTAPLAVTDTKVIVTYVVDPGEDPFTAELLINVAHTHNMTEVAAVPEGCTTPGNVHYWHCSECGNDYSTQAGAAADRLTTTTVPAAGHSMTEVTASPATCTAAGNVHHWHCGTCGKNFDDEAGTTEINDINTTALGHDWSLTLTGGTTTYNAGDTFALSTFTATLVCARDATHNINITEGLTADKTTLAESDAKVTVTYSYDGHDYTCDVDIHVNHVHTPGALQTRLEPTCEDPGHVAYYQCSICTKYFSDAECTNQITDISIPAAGHSMTEVAAADAGCTTPGNIHHWHCERCSKNFDDEAGTTEIADVDTSIAGHDWSLTLTGGTTTYNAGDTFALNSFTATLVCARDAAHNMAISTGLTADKTTLAKTDTKVTVTYSYDSHDYTFDVAVAVLTGITATSTKTEYDELQTVDKTAITVTASYSDGTTAPIDAADFTVTPSGALSHTDTSVTVSYGGESSSFNITVSVVQTGIDATLKSGKVYYANGKATVVKEDFNVVKTYSDGSTSAVDPDDYTITVPNDFAFNGGSVKITCGDYDKTVAISLTAVVLDSITIKRMPNTVFFEGDEFEYANLELTATYNDGSTADITTGFTVSLSGTLTLSHNGATVTVSYTDGVTKEDTYTISVSVRPAVETPEELIPLTAVITVNAGSAIAVTKDDISVNLRYDTGRVATLESSEFSIDVPEGNVVFGKSYAVTVTLVEDSAMTVQIPVEVVQTVEGENFAYTIGGSAKKTTEAEYSYIDGVLTKGEDVSFVGAFGNAIKNGYDSAAVYYMMSDTDCTSTLTVRAGNGMITHDADGYRMSPLQVNTVMSLVVNGTPVAIGDDVILAGSGPHTGYAALYDIFFTFDIPNVPLAAGCNTIVIRFHESTLGAAGLNHWGESASMNVDKLMFKTTGAAVAAGASLTGVTASGITDYIEGNTFNTSMFALVGSYSDGSHAVLDLAYTLDKTGELALTDTAITATYAGGTATLALEVTKAISAAINISTALSGGLTDLADLMMHNGKPCYVLKGTYTGKLRPYMLELSGNSRKPKLPCIDLVLNSDETFVAYFDMSGITEQFYPHFYINDKQHDASTSDVKNTVTITETSTGKYKDIYLVYGGKLYRIYAQWNMPTVMPADIDSVNFVGILREFSDRTDLANLCMHDNKPCYVLRGVYSGTFNASDFVLFDSTKELTCIDLVLDNTNHEFTAYFDMSTLEACDFYAHLKVSGSNWDGNKVDVKNSHIPNSNTSTTITITDNGFKYTLFYRYNMPNVKVQQV